MEYWLLRWHSAHLPLALTNAALGCSTTTRGRQRVDEIGRDDQAGANDDGDENGAEVHKQSVSIRQPFNHTR